VAEDAALETFDKPRRTVAIRCYLCRWKFRCPVEQLNREICRACESKHREVAHAVQSST
jgi:hypothetical protein